MKRPSFRMRSSPFDAQNTSVLPARDMSTDVMEVVSRKAGAILGHPVRTITVDLTKKPEKSPRMEQLMNFGRSHGDIIKIKNQ